MPLTQNLPIDAATFPSLARLLARRAEIGSVWEKLNGLLNSEVSSQEHGIALGELTKVTRRNEEQIQQWHESHRFLETELAAARVRLRQAKHTLETQQSTVQQHESSVVRAEELVIRCESELNAHRSRPPSDSG